VSERSAVSRVAAISLVAATACGAAASLVVSPKAGNPGGAPSGAGLFVLCAAFTAVGAVLAWRRPRNPIGWLFLGSALCLVVSAFATAYAVLDYRLRDGRLALGWVAALAQDFWAPAIVMMVASILVFPDGRPSSRLVRGALAVLVLVGAVWLLGASGIAVQEILTHSVRIDASGDLYAIDHVTPDSAWWIDVVQPAFFVTAGALWLLWIGSQFSAYRRSSGDRRLQLKWLYGGAALAVCGGFLSVFQGQLGAGGTLSSILGVAGTLALAALPVGIAVAVFKFHLYDVDRVVSRTIAWGLVTAGVVGCYAGFVTLSTKAIGLSSPVAVAASTLVAAALFNPLRRRVQRGVDRRFNRARYDAELTVAAFSTALRTSIGLQTVHDELLETVRRAVEPSGCAVLVRRGEQFRSMSATTAGAAVSGAPGSLRSR
jgi:hypothetical protein